MAARFVKSSFKFERGEKAPKHEEGWAWEVQRDPALWHVDGHDTFANEVYELASNLEDADAAELLARAARRQIQSFQVGAGSLQDTVQIIYPTVSSIDVSFKR